MTLEYLKKHLNVDHDEDDAYIGSLLEVATSTLEHLLNRPLSEVELNGELPAPLKHSIRMLVAKLYEYREGDKPGKAEEVAFTLSNLFLPYRKER